MLGAVFLSVGSTRQEYPHLSVHTDSQKTISEVACFLISLTPQDGYYTNVQFIVH